MRREDTVRLNCHAVARRIEALGVKQWWLARMVGVDRKTVSRWLTGKVKRVAIENAEHARSANVWLLSSDVTGTRETADGEKISYGPTALIDPAGSVVDQLPLMKTGVLCVEIPE